MASSKRAMRGKGPCENSRMIQDAVAAIARGGLIVMPTDTVYGIAADPFSSAAVERLLAAKGRGENMPPPVLAPSWAQIKRLADVPEAIRQFWPGPLTVIVKRKVNLGWERETVALRIPENEVALELLEASGPLAVTSANLTGEPPALTVTEAQSYFGANADIYIDGGRSQLGVASTIVDLSGRVPRLVRQGTLDWSRIECALISS